MLGSLEFLEDVGLIVAGLFITMNIHVACFSSSSVYSFTREEIVRVRHDLLV